MGGVKRRKLAVAGVLLALCTTGCALVSLLLAPIKLLFSALGSLVDAVAVVEPIEGPAPALARIDDQRWEVGPVEPGSRFRVTISASGFESRSWDWPEDFAGLEPTAAGEIGVTCRLDPASR